MRRNGPLYCAALLALCLAIGACTARHAPSTNSHARWADPQLDSLDALAIETLRARRYGSTINPLKSIETSSVTGVRTLLARYDSDGLGVFTRVDIPGTEPPASGYPVVIFVHGWYGLEAAPGFDFFREPDSQYARLVAFYAERGFIVLSPALRGHGRIDGVAADGIEFLEAWDNGSYLSPLFYAIDVLNLLDGVESLESLDTGRWKLAHPVRIDRGRIGISGHSQGADAALTALAVSGEGSAVRTPLAAGSLWAGCFAPRFEQAAVYGPMADTLEAFMAGDGRWTGSAVGRDGSVNPEFVFGYPPDWIATVDTASPEWTWQAETWSVPTVNESLDRKFGEMYRALQTGVDGLDGLRYTLAKDESGRTQVTHHPAVTRAMQAIDAYRHERFLTEPLHLHHSDQDYYSIPRWNRELAARLVSAGGDARHFNYEQNSHALAASEYEWFSSGEVVAGFDYMLQRDARLFSGLRTVDPAKEPQDSPDSLKRYATALSNEFFPAFTREPVAGLPRRVVRFSADGLEQYALVVEPAGEPPSQGWPVLLMSHGYHPNPPDNGRTADGRTDRPGDYYRGLPAAYARAGFLVVWPDFRGHNVSEGFDDTQSDDPPARYARDLVAAFRAVPSLPRADASNVFLWGHSMGGNVTLRALAALDGEVAAASVWSTWLGDGPADQGGARLPVELTTPLIVQHGKQDTTVSPHWAEAAGRALEEAGKDTELLLHTGSGHLFEGPARVLAIAEDARFFLERLHP